MDAPKSVANRFKTLGMLLVVVVSLLDFHIPHFFLESRSNFGVAEYLLELVLLANVIASIIAAVGIYRSRRWGWLIGIAACAFSGLLWLMQETVGLPGLPQQWLEPSRLVSLIVGACFVVIAWHQLRRNTTDPTSLAQ
jgi:hypothetical protein